MRRITKKLYDRQYIPEYIGDFPLCCYLYSKEFKKLRKKINKLGRLEDKLLEFNAIFGGLQCQK